MKITDKSISVGLNTLDRILLFKIFCVYMGEYVCDLDALWVWSTAMSIFVSAGVVVEGSWGTVIQCLPLHHSVCIRCHVEVHLQLREQLPNHKVGLYKTNVIIELHEAGSTHGSCALILLSWGCMWLPSSLSFLSIIRTHSPYIAAVYQLSDLAIKRMLYVRLWFLHIKNSNFTSCVNSYWNCVQFFSSLL